jgi:hypothetical protein
MVLRRVDGRFEITVTRPNGYDRPWAHNPARSPMDGSESGRSANPQLRDATPSIEDLEAGDQ